MRPAEPPREPREIEPRDLELRLEKHQPTYLIDVRQPWEHELVRLADDLLAPLDRLSSLAAQIRPPEGALVVCYCHHGVRSLHAAAMLSAAGVPAVSLAGGIERWATEIDPSMSHY